MISGDLMDLDKNIWCQSESYRNFNATCLVHSRQNKVLNLLTRRPQLTDVIGQTEDCIVIAGASYHRKIESAKIVIRPRPALLLLVCSEGE